MGVRLPLLVPVLLGEGRLPAAASLRTTVEGLAQPLLLLLPLPLLPPVQPLLPLPLLQEQKPIIWASQYDKYVAEKKAAKAAAQQQQKGKKK